jgi:diguanylate cyclase (GGDEF)-like protein/PAS domain S-box-containing protein
MRLTSRILLSLAGLFSCYLLVQVYLDYRAAQGQARSYLERGAETARALVASKMGTSLPEWVSSQALNGVVASEESVLPNDKWACDQEAVATHDGLVLEKRESGSEYYHYTRLLPLAKSDDQTSQQRLLSIQFPAELSPAITSADLHQRLLIHVMGTLLLFVLSTWLINRFLFMPIGRLKRTINRLVDDEGGENTQLSVEWGLEEVSQKIEQMADTIRQRERALKRQQALYAVLSQTNKLIIRDVEPCVLFERFCEIAVSYGDFAAAWIGKVDLEKQQVKPEATSDLRGLQASPAMIELTADAPLGMAVYGRCPVIIDQLDKKHSDLSWCQPVDMQIGESAAVLPIQHKGQVYSLLAVYAESPGYFDEIIQDLLNEVVGDIAFAIENHARYRAHARAHRQLARSSRHLRKLNQQMCLLLESTGEGIFGVDLKGYCTFINKAGATMLGYGQEQLLRQPIHRLIRLPEQAQASFGEGMDRQRVPRKVKDESFRRSDGIQFPVEYSTHPMIEESQLKGAVTVFRDVTETRSMLREMRFLASHDPLTHLFNRHTFDQCLHEAFSDARDYGFTHVVFYMDLDQFKLVNDTCGHGAGDTMLRHLAHQLRQAIGTDGVLARLGGDEFGLLLERSSLEQGLQVANRIFEAVRRFRFSWEGRTFSCGVSIGIAELSAATENTHAALSAADTACYVAKDMGRNRVHVYRPYDEEIARQQGQMRWVNRIESAIQKERFYLLQQPILSIGKQAIGDVHVEFLLRMRDEGGREIAPGAFIPAAERYNLMGNLDRWVVRNAFHWLAGHPDRLEELGLCAINLSGQSLGDAAFYEYILEQLRENKLSAEKISFEITETAVVSRLDQAARFISLLKRRGFRFALDDFGTGMSSFAYLKSLPVDYLKIDGSFVKNMLNDPVDKAMVESINHIGHLMGLRTVAEYVESDQILEQLIDLGIDYAQGFGVARPSPLSEGL